MEFPIPQTTIVDISKWRESEGSDNYFPLSTLEKQVYEHKYKHKKGNYLFKHSWTRNRGEYSAEILHQMWVELIAVYVAHQLGVVVPQTAVAFNDTDDSKFKYGILSKWFYNKREVLIHGSDFLQSNLKDNNKSLHALCNILKYSKEKEIPDSKEYWARLLLFDCLIGNTDRHHRNWGIIRSPNGKYRFAPAFDNGVALGFRVVDKDMTEFDHANFTQKFRHKIPIQEGPGTPNIEKILGFLVHHLQFDIGIFINKLDIKLLREHIEASQIGLNPELGEKYRLSDMRKEFIINFIHYRTEYIAQLWKEMDR